MNWAKTGTALKELLSTIVLDDPLNSGYSYVLYGKKVWWEEDEFSTIQFAKRKI